MRMKLFGKKKQQKRYDSEKLEPAVRSSICTGEQVAGFINKETGNFTEIQLLKTPADLEAFKVRYGIEGEVKVFY
ncbi:MAG: hypothetical protein IJM73_07130 [Spirochaetales bacterium]|nr:hypothetical protein [Spirochaetales bacterium]